MPANCFCTRAADARAKEISANSFACASGLCARDSTLQFACQDVKSAVASIAAIGAGHSPS